MMNYLSEAIWLVRSSRGIQIQIEFSSSNRIYPGSRVTVLLYFSPPILPYYL